MKLTTSDIHTLVTQGLRTRYGRLIDTDQAFRDWLEAHDQAVINAAFAFSPPPTLVPLTTGELVERMTSLATTLRGAP